MGKLRLKKTNRGETSSEIYLKACKMIINSKSSIRSAAKFFGLCHVTLRKYYLKYLNGEKINPGYHPHNKVFTEEQELLLVNYCQDAAKLYYGLPNLELRKLAYEFAKIKNLNYPNSWNEKKMVGLDWLKTFIKKHPEISTQSSETINVSRMTSFNRINVNQFYNNLASVNEQYNFKLRNIWNLGEILITTLKSTKIIQETGSITSGECGKAVVTTCLTINAIGDFIPPFFLFPRVKFNENFLKNGPTDCSGSANKTGRIQVDDFLLYLKHFIEHVKPSEKNQMLLVLNNHNSYISFQIINYCRDNFIVLLSIPPYTSHKLQPFDRSILGPLRDHYTEEVDNWRKSHPRKQMSIYNIPGIVAKALPLAVTSSTIITGFECTGICPYNRNIFSDDEFAPEIFTTAKLPQNFVSVDSLSDQPISDLLEQPTTDPLRLNQTIHDPVGQPSAIRSLISFIPSSNESPDNESKSNIQLSPIKQILLLVKVEI